MCMRGRKLGNLTYFPMGDTALLREALSSYSIDNTSPTTQTGIDNTRKGVKTMRQQNLYGLMAVVLIVVALLALGSFMAENVAAENSPDIFSFSPGAVGMITGPGYVTNGATFELPNEMVVDAVQAYVEQYGNQDLTVARQLEFSLAYQVELIEQSSGRYAFSLMVGKDSGQVSPKAGPNLLWNTRYGPALAEVGGGYGMAGRLVNQTSTDKMSLPESEAHGLATLSTRAIDEGLTLDGTARRYYGFYQFDLRRGGTLVGTLTVNGYSGQVWYEKWGEGPITDQTLYDGGSVERAR